MQTHCDIVDFHNHHIPARFELTAVRAAPPNQRARWEALARKLPDEDLLLKDVREDAPQARPTLEVAAKLGAPMFVHPVAPQPLTRQMAPYGLIGTLFARGTVNSASLIALIEGGVFAQLPGLRVVVTAHAIGGLAMLAGLSKQSALPAGTIEVLRQHVFIDTTLFHPALIRASVDLVGVSNVLAGSDWLIAGDNPIGGLLTNAMQQAGLSEEQQKAIAAENCQRLMGIG